MVPRKNITNIPTSLDLNELSQVVLYLGNIDRLITNSKMLREAPGIKCFVQGKKYILHFYSSNAKYTFRIPFDIGGASGDRSSADDILTFILYKFAHVAQNGNQEEKQCQQISFHLNELVGDNNLFTDIANARRALVNAYYAIHGIDIEITRPKDKEQVFTNIISDMKIKNGIVTISLGKYIEWEKFANPYISIPLKSTYALTMKARRTCKALYRHIRKKAVSDNTILPMSFIPFAAGIPIDYDHPKRTKEVIQAIVDEINGAKDLRIHIAVKYSDEKNLDLWLKKSILIIYVKGYLIEDMKQVQKKRAQKDKKTPNASND